MENISRMNFDVLKRTLKIIEVDDIKREDLKVEKEDQNKIANKF